MTIHATHNRRGQLVFYDGKRHSIVDAIGPRVTKWVMDAQDFQSAGGPGTDPTGYTTTVVEAGTGTSEAEASDEAGIEVELVTAGNENDGINLQAGVGEAYKITTSNDVYFGIKLQADEATQSDFFVGLAVTNTNALGGVTDGIYFECLDGGTGISAVTEKNTSETQSDSLGTFADDTDVTLEFYTNGATVTFLVNGAVVATHTAGIPDDEALRPTIQFLNGEAAVHRMKIKWARAFALG